MSNSIGSSKVYEHLAATAFVFIFPGFFLYQYFLAQGLIYPFLGQYFGNVSALFFVLLIPSVLKDSIPVRSSASSIFVFILSWWLLFAISNFAFGKPTHFDVEMFAWSFSGILFNCVCYLIAARLNLLGNFNIFIISVICTGALTLFSVGEYGILNLQQTTQVSKELIASYQGFARSLSVPILLLCASLWQSSRFFPLVACWSLVILFFNGARSEFIVLFSTLLFVFAFYASKSPRRIFEFFVYTSIFLAACYFSFQLFPSQSRMFQLLDISSSASYADRADLLQSAFIIINRNAFWGSYGAHTQLGGIGYYAHNVISAWADLGLIAILCYVFLFVLMWLTVLKNFPKHSELIEYKALLFFLFFVTIMLVFSKDYSYMLTGFLVGLYSKYLQASSLMVDDGTYAFIDAP